MRVGIQLQITQAIEDNLLFEAAVFPQVFFVSIDKFEKSEFAVYFGASNKTRLLEPFPMIFGMFRSWSARKTASVIFRNEKLKLSLSKLEQLPSLTETAARAIAMAKDPDTPVKEFVSLIKRDGSLTAAILKAANNVPNAGAHSVGSIERAIERLGLHGCSRTIEAFGMKESFRPTHDRTREVCQLLWRHSFFTANVCRGLNRALRLGFGGEEFCAGMLHDVGRLIIAASDIDNFAMVDQMDFIEGPETLENEMKYWDTDHCSIGVEFAYKSRLPSSLANAILYHHAPEKAESDRKLVALVAFADQVTNHAQRYRRISNFDLTNSSALKLLGAGNTQTWTSESLATVLSATVKKAIMATRTLIKGSEN